MNSFHPLSFLIIFNIIIIIIIITILIFNVMFLLYILHKRVSFVFHNLHISGTFEHNNKRLNLFVIIFSPGLDT